MSPADCGEMRILIQADADGELAPAEAARMVHHLASCSACAAFQSDMLALSARVRSEATRFAAPASLRVAVAAATKPAASKESRLLSFRGRRLAFGVATGFGLGLAASLAIMLLRPATDGLSDELVSDHIRALQPGHLMDVISTDQHTVKPWFDGRIDFAPPVKDFTREGFPLAGARLDYLAGRPASVLVFQRRKHVIDLYIWPEGRDAPTANSGSRHGYHFIGWRQTGMVFWAVSDLNQDELSQFVGLWRR